MTTPSKSVSLSDGSLVEFADDPIGMGAEKLVFRSRDLQRAVYFYRNLPHIISDRQGRLTRLHAVLNKFNLTTNTRHSEFWRSHFCWPEAALDPANSPPPAFFSGRNRAPEGLLNPLLGFVAPIYPENFFFTTLRGKRVEKKAAFFIKNDYRRKNVPPEEHGNLRNILVACAKISRGLRRLHQSGLAHGDISYNNVLVDPRNADARIIDLDGLVVPNIAPPTVLGTPGYIAPEVVAQRQTTSGLRYEPSRTTDWYSMAVLFYELLFCRHPLEGRQVLGNSPEENDYLKLGSQALFVEHPSNKSNSLNPPPVLTIGRLGPFLEKLFLKTFVDGLQAPQRRADAGEWENAFYQTLDLLHPSPSGNSWTIMVPGRPMRCMASNQRFTWSVPMGAFLKVDQEGRERRTDRRLILYRDRPLYDWHRFNGMAPDESLPRPFKEQARCFYDNAAGGWKLRNLSDQAMVVRQGGALPNERIEPGRDVTIKRGLKLQLAQQGPTPHQSPRLIEFDFQDP